MARRKQDLASKLAGGGSAPAPAPGWRDQVTPPPPAAPVAETTSSQKAAEYVRKTYLISPELIERLERLAHKERVGINELARFLLGAALDQAERGELEIPTIIEERRRITP